MDWCNLFRLYQDKIPSELQPQPDHEHILPPKHGAGKKFGLDYLQDEQTTPYSTISGGQDVEEFQDGNLNRIKLSGGQFLGQFLPLLRSRSCKESPHFGGAQTLT
jgi:hypothetical protein